MNKETLIEAWVNKGWELISSDNTSLILSLHTVVKEVFFENTEYVYIEKCLDDEEMITFSSDSDIIITKEKLELIIKTMEFLKGSE